PVRVGVGGKLRHRAFAEHRGHEGLDGERAPGVQVVPEEPQPGRILDQVEDRQQGGDQRKQQFEGAKLHDTEDHHGHCGDHAEDRDLGDHLDVLAPGSDAFRVVEEGGRFVHVVLDVGGEVAHDELVYDHPGGKGAEADDHESEARLLVAHGEGQQHHGEEAEEELGELGLDRATGGDRVHADVVVDRVHLVNAIECGGRATEGGPFGEDRVVAAGTFAHVLGHGFFGKAGSLGRGGTAVVDAIEREVDTEAVRECVFGVVRGGQRDPPDRRKVGGDQRDQGDQRKAGNQAVLVLCC